MRLEPLISGGGQERGIRSGTVPTPLAVGLGEACRISGEEMEVSCLKPRMMKIYFSNNPAFDFSNVVCQQSNA